MNEFAERKEEFAEVGVSPKGLPWRLDDDSFIVVAQAGECLSQVVHTYNSFDRDSAL